LKRNIYFYNVTKKREKDMLRSLLLIIVALAIYVYVVSSDYQKDLKPKADAFYSHVLKIMKTNKVEIYVHKWGYKKPQKVKTP
jgi:hypothetical protein